jgi:hypothetical protein
LVIESEFEYFFHHEYFGEHVCIVNFIDLIAHENGLFVGLVIKLGNLVDALFGLLNIMMVVLVFILDEVDGLGELLFLFVEFFELVDADVGGESGLEEAGFELFEERGFVLVDGAEELVAAWG